MKNLLLITLISLFGCGLNKQTEVESNDSKQPIQKTEAEKPPEVINAKQPIEPTNNEQSNRVVFVYIDEPNETKQNLTVIWLSKDSVEFELLTETMLCNYEERGTAILKQGTEVDEDEDGMSYLTSEYEVVDAGKLWSLKIPEPERDKAKITYIYEQPRDECSPYDDLMKRSPSNKTYE